MRHPLISDAFIGLSKIQVTLIGGGVVSLNVTIASTNEFKWYV